MQYRKRDVNGKFVIRTGHTRTSGGQQITGELLHCESGGNGASDYCMHCSQDMGRERGKWPYCPALNRLAYGPVPPTDEDVAAFGCDTEAKGGKACTRWCGNDECAVTFARENGDA